MTDMCSDHKDNNITALCSPTLLSHNKDIKLVQSCNVDQAINFIPKSTLSVHLPELPAIFANLSKSIRRRGRKSEWHI